MFNLNKTLAYIAALVVLSGCVCKPTSHVALPASMTSPCEPLEQLQGMTGKDLTQNITNNAAIHYKCVDRYNALVEAVKSR